MWVDCGRGEEKEKGCAAAVVERREVVKYRNLNCLTLPGGEERKRRRSEGKIGDGGQECQVMNGNELPLSLVFFWSCSTSNMCASTSSGSLGMQHNIEKFLITWRKGNNLMSVGRIENQGSGRKEGRMISGWLAPE